MQATTDDATAGPYGGRRAVRRRSHGRRLPRRSFARQASSDAALVGLLRSKAPTPRRCSNQLQRYMDAHPNVTIERTPIPFADLKQKLLQGAAAGELPDIAVIDNPDHQAFAALGILEDLTERVTAWGQAERLLHRPLGLDHLAGPQLRHPRQQQLPRPLVPTPTFTGPAEVAPPTNWEELTRAAAALTRRRPHGARRQRRQERGRHLPVAAVPLGDRRGHRDDRLARAGSARCSSGSTSSTTVTCRRGSWAGRSRTSWTSSRMAKRR